MKKILLFFVLAASVFAQSVQVEKIVKVNTGGRFYFPKFSPNDDALLLTSSNYKGLYLLNLRTLKIETITEENGAGFKAKFDFNGDKIFFRTYKLVDGKKYESQKILEMPERKVITLFKDKRELTPPIKTLDGDVFCFLQGRRAEIEKSLMKNSGGRKSVFIRNSNIFFSQNENEKVLKPFGDGIYVWASLSPEGNFIAFTYGGKGSFVMDTDGNVVKNLGELHFPRWSPDGKWIAGMNDRDNGYDYTSSDIIIVNLKSLKKFNVTKSTDKIEMYPEWSSDGSKITFHDLQGNIYIAKLYLTEG